METKTTLENLFIETQSSHKYKPSIVLDLSITIPINCSYTRHIVEEKLTGHLLSSVSLLIKSKL